MSCGKIIKDKIGLIFKEIKLKKEGNNNDGK